jgi:hypothetical protein
VVFASCQDRLVAMAGAEAMMRKRSTSKCCYVKAPRCRLMCGGIIHRSLKLRIVASQLQDVRKASGSTGIIARVDSGPKALTPQRRGSPTLGNQLQRRSLPNIQRRAMPKGAKNTSFLLKKIMGPSN